MNEYFENPEQVEKVPKSSHVKIFQKIWTATKIPKNYSDYEKNSLLVLVMEHRCGQEINWKPMNDNTTVTDRLSNDSLANML